MRGRGGWSFAWGESGEQPVLTLSGITGMHRWSVGSWDLTHEVSTLLKCLWMHGCTHHGVE